MQRRGLVHAFARSMQAQWGPYNFRLTKNTKTLCDRAITLMARSIFSLNGGLLFVKCNKKRRAGFRVSENCMNLEWRKLLHVSY